MKTAIDNAIWDTLASRLERIFAEFPPDVADDIAGYRDRRALGEAESSAAPPFWLLLPTELARRYGGDSMKPALPVKAVSDLLWGQYGLYLAFRMQDDLLDEESRRTTLILAADRLLFEARAVFHRHLARPDEFWRIFDDCLKRTVVSNARADHLARSSDYDPVDMLILYAEIASVFKIASAGVCILVGQTQDLGNIFRLSDSIATYDQIIDDLEDMAKDLSRGHYNYAATMLLQTESATPDPAETDELARLARRLVYSNGFAQIIEELRRQADRASAAMAELGLPLADKLSGDMCKRIAEIETRHHHLRHETVFGGVKE